MKKNRIRRFSPVQRFFHMILMLTFLVQGGSGLARMYIETPWGKMLAGLFGGYETALVIHIWVGIFMLCGFLVHVLYVFFRIDWKNFPACLFGPDSLLLQPRDIKEFFLHVAWFLGLARAPRFDRWGYWEKFDYWAVFWGMIIMGGTGIILAWPIVSTRYMPGWVLNVVFWVHRIEAILAMGHIFMIHFFIAHLRRHNFPMDRAMFEGSVDFEATRHEKPEWVERLEGTGAIEKLRVSEAPPGRRIIFYIFGYAMVAFGVFLLVGGIANSLRITW